MREGLINSHKYRMRREENGGLVAKRKMAYFQISPTGDRLSLAKLRYIRMYCKCKILKEEIVSIAKGNKDKDTIVISFHCPLSLLYPGLGHGLLPL